MNEKSVIEGRKSDPVSTVFSVIGNLSKKSSDVILAFLMMAIIGLMILPLPLVLIDTLVALNMALGVMLVLMAIYVNSPLQFSAFPSVLLISTLFRLALSIATTRMILLQGDAGNIIDTFGQMVAGGNIVVGLVVFLIITLVQFLVIAKGSERVAEVGARFTLDAMPGKQLSIDSDLRSGVIDKAEARKKRADLERESQLHGSLDGAMKFVKGDAIAGIVVIIINLLGGLAVGVFQLDMSAGAAMGKYSILTIGDGLVAQIPALFGAMAAGLIVTRVSDTETEQHLGSAIGQQFTSIPRVSLVAGVMCLFFALVPGFPTGIFTVLGLILMFTGAMLIPAVNLIVRSYSTPAFDSVMQRKAQRKVSRVNQASTDALAESVPIAFKVPGVLAQQGADTELQNAMEATLARHQRNTGVMLPPVAFNWLGDEQTDWSLEVFDVPVTSGVAPTPHNIQTIADQGMLAIRRNITLFVGLEQTNRMLNKISDNSPEVVKEVQRALSLQSIS
ncbi:MAG: FHIPEP family type III secretion protein, partial [Pseudomonadota bacterium]